MTLDCENFDTCILSLARITSVAPTDIVSMLSEMDLDKKYSSNDIVDPPDRFLLYHLKEEHKVTTAFTSSYWFHNSRVKKGTDFKIGILPLGLILKEVTDLIDSLAKTITLSDFGKSIEGSSNAGYHFGTKVADKNHWGPYAFLVRQTAIQRPPGFHDYLKMPEIVHDYIGLRYHHIKAELEEKYYKSTESCIVKFKLNKNEEYLIGKALYYMYLILRGEDLCVDSNTCHDNKGEIIDAGCIHKIEYLFG